MPNKSSRFVNGSLRNRRSSGFFNVLSQGGLVFLASLVALVSGGVAGVGVGLIVLCPVLAAAMLGWERARPSIFSALVALLLLGAMAVLEIVPPPIGAVQAYVPWLFLGGAGLAQLLMLGKRQAIKVDEVPTAAPQGEHEDAHAPYLIVLLSAHGRIRKLSGNLLLLPGARLGKEIEPLLKVTKRRPVTTLSADRGECLIFAAPDVEPLNAVSGHFDDIAGLGHDLKSPLTSILGFAQMMRDKELGPDASRYEAYPALIHESGTILKARVEALLELIKAESDALDLEFERVDVSAQVEQVVRALVAQTKSAGVSIEAKVSPQTFAFVDDAAFARILENLLTNAVKYTPEGGKVLVTSEVFDEWTITSVTDQGTGIAPDDLSKLAAPYTQATHTGTREGTGLGLALVKRLVALQGGEFRIRSAEGFGTQMIVKLPAYAGQDTVRAAE